MASHCTRIPLPPQGSIHKDVNAASPYLHPNHAWTGLADSSKASGLSTEGKIVNLKQQREEFEQKRNILESVILTFHGVEGYDVYNTSIPFSWEGNEYLFGRVERRSEWARS